jgi:hypothetical protein
MKWYWVHPISGGAILIALNNVCYFFGTEDGHSEIHFTNGEVIKVFEGEEDFLNIMNR